MTVVTEQIKLEYRLMFEAPFHFGAGLRRGLIHRTVAKGHQEYLIVPGTTIKGVVRERCEQLADLFRLNVVEPHDTEDVENRIREARSRDPNIVDRIFGSRFRAGTLFFDDAQLADFSTHNDETAPSPPEDAIDRIYFDGKDEEEKGKYKRRQVETRTQVSLSRLTRTAKSGHLYTSEYGLRQLCFEGCIYGYLRGFKLSDPDQGTYSLLLLLAGLLSIDRMGGMKSTGAGQVGVQIKRLQVDEQPVDIDSFLGNLPEIEVYWLEREERS